MTRMGGGRDRQSHLYGRVSPPTYLHSAQFAALLLRRYLDNATPHTPMTDEGREGVRYFAANQQRERN